MITTKRRKICNGIQIEPGMSVQVVSQFHNPVTVNGGQAVEDAFFRVFGISLKKANALNLSDLDVKCLWNNYSSIMEDKKWDSLMQFGKEQLTNCDFSKQKQKLVSKGESFGDALSKAIDSFVNAFIKK